MRAKARNSKASWKPCVGQAITRIAGKRYQRAPSGYDPNHRRADLLRYAGLSAFAPRL